MKLSSTLLFINEENDKFYFVIKFDDIKFKSSDLVVVLFKDLVVLLFKVFLMKIFFL